MWLKNKYRLSITLKVAIVFLAAFYISWRLLGKGNSGFSATELIQVIQRSENIPIFLFVLFLMPINWFLETWKWKIIASEKITISMKDALRGVLAGVTMGTATPNRVGEFAGRVFAIDNVNRVELLLLSFISSFCQVLVTIFFGVFGLLINLKQLPNLNYISWVLLISGALIFSLAPFLIKLFPKNWKNKLIVLQSFPKRKLFVVLGLSTLRYLVYVFQFLLLLYMIVPEMNWQIAFRCITITYFVVTMIPTFSFTEVLVRGSVASAVFYDIDPSVQFADIAFIVAILLWTINVAIPSLIGSVFVFKLKFFKSDN